MEDTKTFVWRSGVTVIRHEQRIEDDAIVFGSYIDNVWRENLSMTFNGDKETKSMAIAALGKVVR
jgi:hypothetical protein